MGPPPLRYGSEKIAALQGQQLMRGISASGYYFSEVECNFRVFQGQRKSRVFQGLPGLVGHPEYKSVKLIKPVHKTEFKTIGVESPLDKNLLE